MMDVKYSIAIRKKKSKNDFFWNKQDFIFQECEIDTLGKYWFADPFVFEWEGVTYIFYEAFDLVTRKGKIGYSILNGEGACTPPHIIIDEVYHLSFPNIFVEDDAIYIMPECGADNTVKLYKAVDFPNSWEVSKIVLSDAFACDSVIVDKDDRRYLITNEQFRNVPNNGSRGCYVKLNIYKLNRFEATDYGKRIKEGDDGVRNGGKIFNSNGVLYRVGQDCRNREYGRGLVLFEIDSLDPYIEHEVRRLDRDEFKSHINRRDTLELMGVHTYNFNDKYEVIDYYIKKEPSRMILLKRKWMRLKNFIMRHL